MKDAYDNQSANNLSRDGRRTPIQSKSRTTTPKRDGIQSVPKLILDPQNVELRYPEDNNSTCATKQNLDLNRITEESPRNSPFKSPTQSTSKDLLRPSSNHINSPPNLPVSNTSCIIRSSPSGRCRISSKSPIKSSSNLPEKPKAQSNLDVEESFDLNNKEKVLVQMLVELRPTSSPRRSENASIQVKKSITKTPLNAPETGKKTPNQNIQREYEQYSQDEFSLGYNNIVSNAETAKKSSLKKSVEVPRFSVSKICPEKSVDQVFREQTFNQFRGNNEGRLIQNDPEKRSEGKNITKASNREEPIPEPGSECDESEGIIERVKQEAISLTDSSSSQIELEAQQPNQPNHAQPNNKEVQISQEASQADQEIQTTKEVPMNQEIQSHHEAQTNQESRTRYTVLEDLQIVNYAKARGGCNNLSRKFWQSAYENDKLLNQTRSIDSLRERYRTHLKYVGEEESNMMQEWISENRENGYAIFENVGERSIKTLRGIESFPENPQQVNQTAKKIKLTSSQSSKPQSKDLKEQRMVIEEKPIVTKRFDPIIRKNPNHPQNEMNKPVRFQLESESSSLSEEEIRISQNSGQKKVLTREPILIEDRTKKRPGLQFKTFEVPKRIPEETRRPVPIIDSGVKRKKYENSHAIHEEVIPAKVMKPNQQNKISHEVSSCLSNPSKVRQRPVERSEEPANRQDRTKEAYKTRFNPDMIHNKQKWLMEQAREYEMSSNEILDLFYWCSMNCQNLARYLQGEKELLWDEREDLLLVGHNKQLAWHVLSRYKGPVVVKEREEFLEKVELLGMMRNRDAGKGKR